MKSGLALPHLQVSDFICARMVKLVDTRDKLEPEGEETISWKPEVIEVDTPPVSKELKKRWSYFIRKVYAERASLSCVVGARSRRKRPDKGGRRANWSSRRL